MKTLKEPDCVEMKWKIQLELEKEFRGMTPEEIRNEQMKRIESNPVFGSLASKWRVVNPR